ncbi:unnamed protein product [Blepharisma stoltei]|uniref:Uncharacterized protein n=1 Tax=Blepharisma stoltei TaxID=1481888 RepID=A0AAU9IQT5_9CILI|nr:unnamed protein product [Blepharisma stoltei]
MRILKIFSLPQGPNIASLPDVIFKKKDWIATLYIMMKRCHLLEAYYVRVSQFLRLAILQLSWLLEKIARLL